MRSMIQSIRLLTAGRFRTPALISSTLVLPFLVLEWVNRRGYQEGFPFPLFALMWLIPFLFVLIIRRGLRSPRAQRSSALWFGLRAAHVAALALLAWLWISLLRDQLPCFLGVPNCD